MRNVCKLLAATIALVFLTGSVLGQRAGGGLAGLLGNSGVQKELKLTDEQIDKAKKVSQDLREKFKEDFAKLRDAKPEERREKFQELNQKISAEAKKGLAGILKPEQMKRLRQIELQQVGLADVEAQTALKLTDEQKKKIKTMAEDSLKDMREIIKNAQGNFEEAREKITKLRKEIKDKQINVLTDDQKKSWKGLLGDPFEVKFERRKKD